MKPTDEPGSDPGRVRDYTKRGLEHLWVHTQQYNVLAEEGGFVVIDRGEGIWLTDLQGREFIDAMSGLWVVAVGHGRREIAEAAARQMQQLAYANPFAYATPPAVDLASKLTEVTPANINRFYFVNSGSEAVETAIRMSKQYHYNRGEKGRYKVISRIGSYHGTTQGALAVSGSSYVNRAPFEPLLPGHIPVPGPGGVGQLMNDQTGLDDVFWADYVDEMVSFHRPETIAALIAEPISASAGHYVPSLEYWQRLREICDRHGIVLIADEVINGFGRTGEWFGVQHFDIEPDLMTVAKGLSSGYAPIAAVMVSDKVAEGFVGEREDAFAGGSTFGAHPMACAVALENVGIIEREGLVANAAETGAYLGERLAELVSRRRRVGSTSGIGLMHMISLVRDSEAGEKFTEEDGLMQRVPRLMAKHGLLARAGAQISIAPPLVITREEVDELVQRLERVIDDLEEELGLA
jgi:adenosylmethionine-8-amino-7-oxononanoate aminotransferase